MANMEEAVARALWNEVVRQTDDTWPADERGMTGLVDAYLDFTELAKAALASLPPDRIEEPTEARGWQPIETAPKDGGTLLARRADAYWALIYWDDDAWVDYWDGEANEQFPPTHWMPLPAPPEAA